jgi:hypothetical protein
VIPERPVRRPPMPQDLFHFVLGDPVSIDMREVGLGIEVEANFQDMTSKCTAYL